VDAIADVIALITLELVLDCRVDLTDFLVDAHPFAS
jgi:hypothetical protein